jgi:Tol biopolymer transport system component
MGARNAWGIVSGFVLVAGLVVGSSRSQAPEPLAERVSVGRAGEQAEGASSDFAMSGDGRVVAFGSGAGNLVSGDTNGAFDVFVRDRAAGETERVSVGPGGAEANDFSDSPQLSGNGRVGAFFSAASNLVEGDTNGAADLFVRDRATGALERVNVSTGGAQAEALEVDLMIEASLSADGRTVAFAEDATNLVERDDNGSVDVFVRDLRAGTTERVSVSSAGAQAGGDSFAPSLSGSGRFVAFGSNAPDLVPDDTNESLDVFVHDRETGATERVSVSSAGAQASDNSFSPAISASGRFVAFITMAPDLVPGDTNGAGDVFVHDRRTHRTERVSVSDAGEQADGLSFAVAISADGRHVSFGSAAANLVPGDHNGLSDIFVRDRRAGTTRRVSTDPAGGDPDGDSFRSAISGDGRRVAFVSDAANLVPGDSNGSSDVFVRER